MNNWQLHENALLDERYYSATHASGLPLVVFPKKLSTTYALLAVNYGSVDNMNADGEAAFPHGIAHFLEHKLFANEDGSDSFERFSAFGADANAYTAYNRTVYLFSCTDRFKESLAELIDFVTHPYFTAQSVEKEQGIIAEEIRMCLDDPYERCYHNMITALYQCHPVREEICGSERSVMAITAEMLQAAYDAHYTLPNMMLIVCGNVTLDEVWDIANARLPKAPGVKPARVKLPQEPAEVCTQHATVRGNVAKPIFSIGIKDSCPTGNPREMVLRDVTMDLLNEMLFSDTGELYNSLYDRNLISPVFGASYSRTRGFGHFHLSGEADDPELVFDEILRYLERVAREGLCREEFERARRILFADYIKAFDSTEEIAETLLSFAIEGADIFQYPEIVQGADFDMAQQIVRELFVKERIVLSVVRPLDEQEDTV